MANTAGPGGATPEQLSIVDRIVAEFSTSRGALIPMLQQVQAEIGYLPYAIMERIAERSGVPPARIFGVASFYSQFRFEPVGLHIIRVCEGTACHVQGAVDIVEAICDEFGVAEGGTTEDGKFTVEPVACLGCCSLAPVIMIDEDTFGRLTPEQARDIVRNYGTARDEGGAKA
jgi:NADH-quinone oxidoreductase subunit E